MAAIFVWGMREVVLIVVVAGFAGLMLLGSAVDLYDRKFKRR